MKWAYGNATDFSFHVKVLATFNRPTISGSLYLGASAPAPVDACLISGHSTFFAGGDDAETQLVLPFPYNFFDITYDRAVVSSNGYVLLYNTGGAVPTRDQNNVSMVTPGLPTGIYPFWDDLKYDPTDSVCVATTGVTPNRFWTVTWKNARINSSAGQATKGTFTAEKLTFSMRVTETTDYTVISYGAPAGGVVGQTRGTTAHIGLNQPNPTKFQINYAKNTAYLPANAAQYPMALVFAFSPINP